MNLNARIFVAGHRGLVGSALLRSLYQQGYQNVVTRTHSEVDLEHQSAVADLFAKERPQYVFLAAAKVGGILANATYPVDFLLRNVRIATNVIEASWRHAVEGLLFLGSSCIYPKLAPQPLKEEYVLGGLLEATNEPYAIAKIAGLELCEAYNRQYGTHFLSVMPTNLYGLKDNYDLETSHVLPALIRKFHLAKLAAAGDWKAMEADEVLHGPIPADFQAALGANRKPGHSPSEVTTPNGSSPVNGPVVRLWGTGSPRREFLFSEDLADACIFLMNQLDNLFATTDIPPASNAVPQFVPFSDHCALAARHLINVGCGEDFSINELAAQVARIVGFRGPVEWDATKPDGTPQKLLDITRITDLGWRPRTTLEHGIQLAYQDYLSKGKS